MKKLLKYFHTPKTFFKSGLAEFSTCIGVMILFGWFYSAEINQLVKNVITSPLLPPKIIDGLATLIGAFMISVKWK